MEFVLVNSISTQYNNILNKKNKIIVHDILFKIIISILKFPQLKKIKILHFDSFNQ